MIDRAMEQAPRNVLLCGHALDVLRTLPDACIQMCVTSPPYYGLRSYGTEPVVWDGVSTCRHVWGEQQRTPWANDLPGPVGLVKNRGARTRSKFTGPFCQECGAWRGELGQEPTPALYVAHLVQVFCEVGRVLRSDGTLWLNLGDSYARVGGTPGGGNRAMMRLEVRQRRMSRLPKDSGLKEKDLLLMPHRVALALQDDGWYVRQDIVWEKPNCLPESVVDRPTRSHEYVFLLSKSQRYYFDAAAVSESARSARMVGDRNIRSVWTIATEAFQGAHYAVFPVALAERCVLAGSRSGDLVLDLFGGRGTTSLVATAHRRDYLYVDALPANVEMARQFIAVGGRWRRAGRSDRALTLASLARDDVSQPPRLFDDEVRT